METESSPLLQKEGRDTRDAGNPAPGSSKSPERPLLRGLSVQQTAILVAGEMAGAGVLALPRTLVKTGWLGVPIIIVMCLLAAFSGKRLGDCWTILESRNVSVTSKTRNPYIIIAADALGSIWGVFVALGLLVTQFGMAVVYLLLAGQIMEQIFLSLFPYTTICIWSLYAAAAVIPLMFLESPRSFSLLGLLAFVSIVVACLLYFIQMMNDIKPFVFRWGIHSFTDFFLGFGTIMFAFGGASSFPTIQNDMTDRSKFNTSLKYSFSAILMLYLPIAIAGYAVYGEAVAPNVSASLTATPLTLVGDVLMVAHLMSAFVILINPVCLEAEQLYKVSDSVGYRALARLSVLGAVLFMGETIPRFYTVLALVGSTSIALTTFILPSYCFLSLLNQGPVQEADVDTSNLTKTLCWTAITVGVLGGALATYSAISATFGTALVVPCYLR